MHPDPVLFSRGRVRVFVCLGGRRPGRMAGPARVLLAQCPPLRGEELPTGAPVACVETPPSTSAACRTAANTGKRPVFPHTLVTIFVCHVPEASVGVHRRPRRIATDRIGGNGRWRSFGLTQQGSVWVSVVEPRRPDARLLPLGAHPIELAPTRSGAASAVFASAPTGRQTDRSHWRSAPMTSWCRVAVSVPQRVEVAGDRLSRPLGVELGDDPLEHLGRRAVGLGPG